MTLLPFLPFSHSLLIPTPRDNNSLSFFVFSSCISFAQTNKKTYSLVPSSFLYRGNHTMGTLAFDFSLNHLSWNSFLNGSRRLSLFIFVGAYYPTVHMCPNLFTFYVNININSNILQFQTMLQTWVCPLPIFC